MNRLRIKHHTGFRYQGDISASYNEARMLPTTGDGQLVLYANLEILPTSSHHSYTDYWGTRVSAFELLNPHQELSLMANTLVEVRLRGNVNGDLSWSELARVSDSTVEFVEQKKQTAQTEPPQQVLDAVREIAARHATPCAAAMEIAEYVHNSVEYVPGVTGVQSTAKEAWDLRKCVCQDFAHITIGALRSMGVPARYVSGYLHSDPEAEVGQTVTGESHAWLEWFAGTWRGFDPTNMIDIGDRHVTVGRGRDYNDVAPLRGVFAGSSNSELFVSVEITKEP